jgi:hypothetical protein
VENRIGVPRLEERADAVNLAMHQKRGIQTATRQKEREREEEVGK